MQIPLPPEIWTDPHHREPKNLYTTQTQGIQLIVLLALVGGPSLIFLRGGPREARRKDLNWRSIKGLCINP